MYCKLNGNLGKHTGVQMIVPVGYHSFYQQGSCACIDVGRDKIDGSGKCFPGEGIYRYLYLLSCCDGWNVLLRNTEGKFQGVSLHNLDDGIPNPNEITHGDKSL